MLRTIFTALLLLQSSLISAQEPITPADSPIIIYQADSTFDDVKMNLELAISDRGMLITNTLHVSQMLERTAKDTGKGDKLYEMAESLEFCSVIMSYRMSSAHPANLSICPLTVSIYTKVGAPDTTYVSYRQPKMLGDAAAVTADLTKLLDDIVREAVE
ncbi:MAG: hypothetical protein RPU64_00855 [Candidatus Sedimenticola sp. (ex Thyasira tokunagai)]